MSKGTGGSGGRRLPLVLAMAAGAAAALSGTSARANTQNDVLASAQDLANTASPPYSSGALPAVTEDVVFRSDFAYANASSLILTAGATGVNISMGTLNDLNATPLVISGPVGASGANRTITLNGGANSVAGAASTDLIYLASGASLTLQNNTSGTRTLGVVLAANGDFDVSPNASLTIATPVISGAFNLRKTGAGMFTLGATNLFGSAGGTNTFTMAGGTLNINSARAVGNANNTFVIAGGTIDNTSPGAITMSSYPVTLQGDFGFTGTNDLSLGTGAISLGTSADASRTIAVNAKTLTLGGVTSDAAGAAATTLNKNGAGTLVLTRQNLFTGGVNVNAGALRVNNTAGSATGTGAIAVKSGGTVIGGNGAADGGALSDGVYNAGARGIISGPVAIESGGHLAPGNGVGTLTTGALALVSGSVLDYEFNAAGGSNDFTSAAGLSLAPGAGGGGGVNLFAEGGTGAFATAGTYHLIGYADAANLANFTPGASGVGSFGVLNPQPGLLYSFSDNANLKTIDLVIAAVPEPTSTGVLLAAVACGVAARRRECPKPMRRGY